MIQLPVVDKQGNPIETIEVNEEVLGKQVHRAALRQAIQHYQAARRVGTASTKPRSEIRGSTRKLYPQKHTGRARAGDGKAPHWRGGGVAFGPRPRSYASALPKKIRLLALRSAYLSKLLDQQIVVVNELRFDSPKTKDMAAILRALKIQSSCLIGIREPDAVLWKSARNLPRVAIKPVHDINACDLLLRRHLLITKDALQTVLDRFSGAGVAPEGAST